MYSPALFCHPESVEGSADSSATKSTFSLGMTRQRRVITIAIIIALLVRMFHSAYSVIY